MLTGLYQYVSMALAKTYTALTKLVSIPVVAEVVMFFNISAFGLALAWMATVWATARLAGRRIWDAAVVAASPLLIFQVFTNFDALATACAACAMLAWARRRPVLAGALIGIGVALKLYPLLLFVPLVILGAADRPDARGRQGGARGGRDVAGGEPADHGAVPAGVVGVLPAQHPPRRRHGLAVQRGEVVHRLGADSIRTWGSGSHPRCSTRCPAVLFVLCCGAIAYIALTAKRRPRLAQLAFLVVAAFLLTNKVWSPQYSLWLVPLAALALPHRRILLAWMTIDALVWVPRMLFLYGEQKMGLPEQWFTTTVLLRDVAVMALCALVIRQIYRPELDLVRAPGPWARVDDPSGGVFEDAPDDPGRWLPPSLRRRPLASMRSTTEPDEAVPSGEPDLAAQPSA